tara:strand:+ start:1495 stop:1845 length:351 start_codon:yes stop_codon:yes gene_type:complete
MKLTKLEYKIVKEITWSDHASDGHGLGGYICHYSFEDFGGMKAARGAMASLVKKGVAEFDTYFESGDPQTWGCLAEKYQKKVSSSENISDYSKDTQNLIKSTGYKITNLEIFKGGG